MTYRDILNEYFIIKKEVNPSYSLRAYARDLEMPSSNLSDVLKDKKGISKTTAERIAKNLNIVGREKQYFIDLVEAENARAKKDKLRAQERLLKNSLHKAKRELNDSYFKLISEWYYYAILEMISLKNFRSDSSWISQKLGITKELTDKAISRLQRLNLIRIKDEKFECVTGDLDTTYDIPSSYIKKHHAQLVNKGLAAMWEQSVDEREVSSLTVAVSEDDLDFVKEKIRNFKNQLNDELVKRGRTRQPSKVYGLTIQFFNLLKETKND